MGATFARSEKANYWGLKEKHDPRLIDKVERVVAQHIAKHLRQLGLYAHANARRTRGYGERGGWRWYVVVPFPWIGQLFSGLRRMEVAQSEELMQQSVEGPAVKTFVNVLHRIFEDHDVTWYDLDTAWRLGGASTMEGLLRANRKPDCAHNDNPALELIFRYIPREERDE